jgi:hypothetical protein
MRAHFKGNHKLTDLIKLSYDDKPKDDKPQPLTDKEMKMKFGSKFKKDG